MNPLATTLWTVVRWAVPCAVVGVLAATLLGGNRVGEEVRRRAEARLAEEFPTLIARVQGASLVSGEGIVLRGVSLVDPNMPQQWRQMVWIDEVRLACSTALTDLASGSPQITAIHLRRPAVHAVRRAGGTWNFAGLWRERSASSLIATTVEDATLLVDDLQAQTRINLRQVSLDLQPGGTDSSGVVWAAVRGGGAGDLFDRINLHGRLAPGTGQFEIEGGMESLEVSPRLWQLVPPAADPTRGTAARVWLAAMRGRIDLGWTATGSLHALQDTVAVVTGRLESGRVEHPSLPVGLRDVTTSFTADRTGVHFDRLEAHAGSTLLRGSGRLAGWHQDADFDLLLEADRLIVGRQWEGLLPEQWALQWSRLSPAGEVDLRAQLTRRNGRVHPLVSLRCRNASLTHYRFPYRLDRTVGTVVLDGETLAIHLTGQAGGHAVQVQGMFRTTPQGTAGAVEVRGDGMRIDDGLLAAMPARSATIVRTLRASGTFDFVFRHERHPGASPAHTNSLGIRLVDCSMSYAGFPYPLSRIGGSIRMVNGHWTIRDISGSNDAGTVQCNGSLVPMPGDDGELTLLLTGAGVVLDRELRDAMPRGMRTVWDDLDPRGNVDFSATIRHAVKARKTVVELHATPREETVSIEPAWFPYRLEKLRGQLDWKDGLLRFSGVRGSHARTTVTTEGVCRFMPEGGWHVSFARLSADRFRADHDVLQAMPEGLRRALTAVRPRGLLSLDGALDIYSTQGTVEGKPGPAAATWDMQLDMEQASLDVGVELEHVHGGVRLRGQSDGRAWQSTGDVAIDSALWRGMQLTAIRGPLALDSGGVRLGAAAVPPSGGTPRRMTARLAGGTLLLDGTVTTGEAGTFAVSASMGDADMEQLTAAALPSLQGGGAQPLRGKVFGVVELSGSRIGTHSLQGRGQVRLRDADMYELPVVVALLKVLRVKAPDRRAFSSSLIDFRIEGPHAYLDNIELSGDAISLVGNGEVDFESQAHLTFRSIMGDSESQLPVMKSVLGGASGQFMLIHVKGSLARPEITTEAFPTLTAALQQLQAQKRSPDRLRSAAVPPTEAAFVSPR